MAAGGETAVPAPPAPASGPPAPAGLLLRPLVFVVDCVRPSGAGDDDGGAGLYGEFMAALRDDGGGEDGGMSGGDDSSVAASYASR